MGEGAWQGGCWREGGGGRDGMRGGMRGGSETLSIMFLAFLARRAPASSRPKPAWRKKQRSAAVMIQTVCRSCTGGCLPCSPRRPKSGCRRRRRARLHPMREERTAAVPGGELPAPRKGAGQTRRAPRGSPSPRSPGRWSGQELAGAWGLVGFPRGWETEILSCHLDERRGDTLGHIHLLDLVEQLGVLRGGFRAREVVLDLHTMCAAGQASGAPVWEAAWCAARRPGSSGSVADGRGEQGPARAFATCSRCSSRRRRSLARERRM